MEVSKKFALVLGLMKRRNVSAAALALALMTGVTHVAVAGDKTPAKERCTTTKVNVGVRSVASIGVGSRTCISPTTRCTTRQVQVSVGPAAGSGSRTSCVKKK